VYLFFLSTAWMDSFQSSLCKPKRGSLSHFQFDKADPPCEICPQSHIEVQMATLCSIGCLGWQVPCLCVCYFPLRFMQHSFTSVSQPSAGLCYLQIME